MSDLHARRDAAIRDLDAIIGRMHGLDATQWRAPSPLEGWDVHHIGTHMVNIVAGLTEEFRRLQGIPVDSDPTPIPQIPHDSPPSTVIASLTTNRNILASTLADLADDVLERSLDAIHPMYAMTGDLVLDMAVFETGVHRYDIDSTFDRGNPGLDLVTLRTIDSLLGAHLARFADTAAERPPDPIAFRFRGTIIKRDIVWDGTHWSDRLDERIPVVTFQGDESALALLMCGRMLASDRRIGVTGDHDAALEFKTWVPGP